MTWDPQRVETLKQLWAEGLSASQIASRIGGIDPQRRDRQGAPDRPAATRAVLACAKAHGASCAARTAPDAATSPSPQNSPAGRPAKPHSTHVPYDAQAFDRDDVAHTTLVDREPGQCNWVIGEPRAWSHVRASRRAGRAIGMVRQASRPRLPATRRAQQDEAIRRVVAEETEDIRPTPMNVPTEPIAIEVPARAEMPPAHQNRQRIETADVVDRPDNAAQTPAHQCEFILEGAMSP